MVPASDLLDRISKGRTDLVFDLLALADWRDLVRQGDVTALQWFVYYNDLTALKAVLAAGGELAGLDLDRELGNAAFFGHWKIVDFLLLRGANPRFADPITGETALHSALCKAGRPAYLFVVRRLLAAGADPNRRSIAHQPTEAFMRDARTKGETPLHRAAAYGDAEIIQLLLDHGADKAARDAHGDSPLSWASAHLRPGVILRLLAFGPHQMSEAGAAQLTSDHGCGWGYGMERKQLGTYLPE